MKRLVQLLQAVLFLLLFLLAMRNSEQVEVRFFFDQGMAAPLSFVILAAFALGGLMGVAAAATTLYRQRRNILRLEREIRDGLENGKRSNRGN